MARSPSPQKEVSKTSPVVEQNDFVIPELPRGDLKFFLLVEQNCCFYDLKCKILIWWFVFTKHVSDSKTEQERPVMLVLKL